jgi:hypothetical protein
MNTIVRPTIVCSTIALESRIWRRLDRCREIGNLDWNSLLMLRSLVVRLLRWSLVVGSSFSSQIYSG